MKRVVGPCADVTAAPVIVVVGRSRLRYVSDTPGTTIDSWRSADARAVAELQVLRRR